MNSRRLAVGTTLAALVLGLAAGPATAATTKPTVGFSGSTVSGAGFTTTVTVNRPPKQISSCAYRVDNGAAVSCGKGSAAGTKATAYALALANQGTGKHTVSVTVKASGGTATGSTNFTVLPPKVFARAWTNLDEIPGYDPNADRLIAELVDTDRSGVLSAGDTLTTSTYPTSFTGLDYTTSLSQTHVVAEVLRINATLASVWLDAAHNQSISFISDPYSQEYFETDNATGLGPTLILDGTNPSGDGLADEILIRTSTPGQPAEGVGDSFGDGSLVDSAYLDVSITP